MALTSPNKNFPRWYQRFLKGKWWEIDLSRKGCLYVSDCLCIMANLNSHNNNHNFLSVGFDGYDQRVNSSFTDHLVQSVGDHVVTSNTWLESTGNLVQYAAENGGYGLFVRDHLWGSRFSSPFEHGYGCDEMCCACYPSNLSVCENNDERIQDLSYYHHYCDLYGVCYCDGYMLQCRQHQLEEQFSELSENDVDFDDIDEQEDYHQAIQPFVPHLQPVLYSRIQTCTICLSSNNGELISLSCGHVFHRVCVTQWFDQSQTCPMCRGVPQMFRTFRRAVNGISNAIEAVQDLNENIESFSEHLALVGSSVNRSLETFELIMHLISLYNNPGESLLNLVTRLWNCLHVVLSIGKILTSYVGPELARVFGNLDTNELRLDGVEQVDFGTLFATSLAAYNFLPAGIRSSIDFMTRHSRVRFLSDSNVFSNAYHYVTAAPKIVIQHLISVLPPSMPFHRTVNTMLHKINDAFDVVYAFLPGTIEHSMTEQAHAIIVEYNKNSSVVKIQQFVDRFKNVFEFFEATYFSIAVHTDVPANIRFILDALRAINRVINAQSLTTRVEPVWFHFYGPTGRGKSTFTSSMVQVLSNMACYVHQRVPGQKEFFDGYHNEPLFLEDDLICEDQLLKYLSFVSPIAQPLDCAAVTSKGIKKFTSSLIMTSGNYLATELVKKKELEHTGQALHRRYYAVHFSDVVFDGVRYHSNVPNCPPTIRVFKYNVKTEMEDLVFRGDPNDYHTFANFMCDQFDNQVQQVVNRPQLTCLNRNLQGVSQFFDTLSRGASYAIERVISSPIVTWSQTQCTNFLSNYIYRVQQYVPDPTTICAICREGACDTRLACGHIFHRLCIATWLQQTPVCPYCRTAAVLPNQIPILQFVEQTLTEIRVTSRNFLLGHPLVSAILEGAAVGFLSGIIIGVCSMIGSLIGRRIQKAITPQVETQENQTGIRRIKVTLAGQAQVYPPRVTSSFPTELERIRNNMLYASFHFSNGDITAGIITFVDGLSFICPAHFLLVQGVLQSECVIYAEDQEHAQLISGQSFVVKFVDVPSDVAIMTFQTSNQPRLFPNISTSFSGELLNRDLFLITPDQMLPVEYPTRLKYDVGYFVFGGKIVCAQKDDSYSYPYEAMGLCGALLCDKTGKIVAMHTLKEHATGNGIARCLNRDVRLQLYKCTEVGQQRYLSPISAFIVDNQSLYRHVPAETSIEHSDLYGVFPIERAPAVLKGKTPQGENILSKAVVKNIKPVYSCNEKAMAYVEYALDRFLGAIKSKSLTEFEVIHGNATIPRIDPKSSAGIPYNAKNSVVIDYDRATFSDTVRKNVNKMKSEFEKGEFSTDAIIFGDTLKDELRDVEKIFKPRLFAAGPLHFTAELKRLFSDLVYRICANRLSNGIMIGINALGKEWDLFAKKLQSKGSRIVPGDFENWDGGMLARFQELANKILSQHTDEPQYALWLLTHLVRTSRLVLDELIVTTHSVPSGHALTAFYNSLINFMYQSYAFYILSPFSHHSMSYIYDQQMKHLYSGKYGDDVVINVSDVASSFFNCLTFSEVMSSIGVGFTTEDKKPHTIPYTTLSQCTFLKRSFVYHSKLQRIVGPLSLKTLMSSMSYVSDKFRMEELVNEKVLNFQREIYLHEFHYANLMSVLTSKYFDVYGSLPELLAEADIQRLYERDEFEQVYGLTGVPQMLKYVCNSESTDTKHRAGVLLAIIDVDGGEQYLLVKGADYVQEDGSVVRGKWGVPKGCVKQGETMQQAAIRELYEETNIVVTKWDLQRPLETDNATIYVVSMTLQHFLKMKVKSNNSEIVSFRLVRDKNEVPLNMLSRKIFQLYN